MSETYRCYCTSCAEEVLYVGAERRWRHVAGPEMHAVRRPIIAPDSVGDWMHPAEKLQQMPPL